MAAYLGVDAGGTSTRAVLLDDTGRCLGYGTSGAGNPTSSGQSLAASAVREASRAALDAAAASPASVREVVLAMAGASTQPGPGWVEGPLAAMGLAAPVTLRSDLLATFCSGTSALAGYAIVAGTGAAAVRVEEGRVARVSDGLGWLLGDVGSGFWIGHRVVREALAALDGRGPETALSAMVLDALGSGPGRVDRPRRSEEGRGGVLGRAVDRLYELRPVELAAFAPLAFAAAPQDTVARRILDEAAAGLMATFDSVCLPDVQGPVVLGGGTASHQEQLPGLIAARIWWPEPPAVVHVLDGTVGAAVLALRAGGIIVDVEVFDRITATLASLR